MGLAPAGPVFLRPIVVPHPPFPRYNRAFDFPGVCDHETYLPTVQSPSSAHARVPGTHAHARWPGGDPPSSRQGAQAPCGVTLVSQRFPRAARLVTAAQYAAVFENRQRLTGRFFSLHWAPNAVGFARLGLVMPKRLARRAVLRNLIKRLAREAFRLWPGRVLPVDVVIRLSAPTAEASRRSLREDLAALLTRLAAQWESDVARAGDRAHSRVSISD